MLNFPIYDDDDYEPMFPRDPGYEAWLDERDEDFYYGAFDESAGAFPANPSEV
jgi:hypothetical protein